MESNRQKQSTETGQLLSAALDLGEQMLICGGEVNRVEDTICRLCKAYGAKRVDVFSITSSIVATADFGEQGVITQTRRISASKFDMTALSELNDLSRRACAFRMSPSKLRKELQRAKEVPQYSFWGMIGCWALISAAFSVFFGGSILDGIISAMIGVVLCIVQAALNRVQVNKYLSVILCSLLGGLLSNLVFAASLPVHPAMINIGNIMLLIPGIGLTNAIRDIFSGDTMSGLLRSSEAIVLSIAIAWGFAATASPDVGAAQKILWVQLLTAGLGSLGYSIWFNVREKRLVWCALGGVLGWGVVIAVEGIGLSEFWGYYLGAVAFTIYAQILARILKCPVTVFVITAAMPLIPGGGLYATMRYAIAEEWGSFAIYGLRTLGYAILISAGILTVMTAVHIIEILEHNKRGRG
ncbi:MAG: threonine/serine exporter ThrE family protein [Lachnospiraceae bacterium]